MHVLSYFQKYVLINLSPKAAEALVKSLVSIAFYANALFIHLGIYQAFRLKFSGRVSSN
jgi:hypothetical protein